VCKGVCVCMHKQSNLIIYYHHHHYRHTANIVLINFYFYSYFHLSSDVTIIIVNTLQNKRYYNKVIKENAFGQSVLIQFCCKDHQLLRMIILWNIILNVPS